MLILHLCGSPAVECAIRTSFNSLITQCKSGLNFCCVGVMLILYLSRSPTTSCECWSLQCASSVLYTYSLQLGYITIINYRCCLLYTLSYVIILIFKQRLFNLILLSKYILLLFIQIHCPKMLLFHDFEEYYYIMYLDLSELAMQNVWSTNVNLVQGYTSM